MATAAAQPSSLIKRPHDPEIQPLTGNEEHHESEQVAPLTEPPIEKCHPEEDEQPTVRYRKTPAWLVGSYLTILVVPWILTCILDERPLTSSTYYDQRGRVDNTQYLSFWGLLSFINALNSISGILTVPITTTVLAYAAVTYSQKRKDSQKLSIEQLFALSDRGWTDVKLLWHSRREGRSSRLLWLGALLVLIGAIQQPLQSVLVTIEPIVAMSCIDVPVNGPCISQATVAGYDASPWAMALVGHGLIVQDVSSTLVTFDNIQAQENLWLDNPYAKGHIGQWDDPTRHSWPFYYGHRDAIQPGHRPGYFVSSLLNGTQTGVLREHALRLNTTVTCKNITSAHFPSPCSGQRPLDVHIHRPNLNISICVPGEVGKNPWTLSRNRQTIDEELFIDFQFENPPLIGMGLGLKDFTTYCKASTSRGYFELGNIMNDFVYGPLLDDWPDTDTIESHTNDYTESGARPKEMDVNEGGWDRLRFGHKPLDSFGIGNMSVSGPLMTAAGALFGNTSLLQLLYNESSTMSPIDTLRSMCTHGNLPFSQLSDIGSVYEDPLKHCYDIETYALDDEDADREIDGLVGSFINTFKDPNDASDLIDMSMFVVNRAVLQKSVIGTGPLHTRHIYTSAGALFAKPKKSLASTIVISILITAQATGLVAAVWFSGKVPTWTATLDSMAVARIGKAMRDEDLPSLGPVTKGDREKLKEVNALVGVLGEDDQRDEDRSPMQQARRLISEDDVDTPANVSERLRLGLGGEGKIDRIHAPVQKNKKNRMKFWK